MSEVRPSDPAPDPRRGCGTERRAGGPSDRLSTAADATRPATPDQRERRASSDLENQDYLAATTLTVTFAATSE